MTEGAERVKFVTLHSTPWKQGESTQQRCINMMIVQPRKGDPAHIVDAAPQGL